MKLSSICLQNFRCFEDTTINFHEQLTVLVGGNGSGKTAVLDGVGALLASIGSQPIAHQSLPITEKDANHINPEGPVLGTCILGGQRYDFRILADENGKKQLFSLNYVGDQHSNVYKKNVAMYYNTHRHIDKNITTSREKVPTEFEAVQSVHQNMLDVYASFATSLGWFAGQEFEEAKQAKQKRNLDHVIPELQAVRDGVTLILGDYEKPYTDKTPAELFIYKKGEPTPYSLSQLSDGYRTMLALVMDLARRMAVVNGEAYTKTGKSVLESPAIVLIDEVELHLHPSWQQRVLPDLMRTFPNTQFIVTTHSPQVISSIPAECVRILESGQIYGASDVTEGVNAARILKEIFGVEPLPQNIRWARYLKKYEQLVYADGDKWDTACAKALQRKLESHYGKNDPKLDELALHIETRQWERDNEASL